jgi:nitrite reductase/ring-hydroxylating ferredoxin subunit
MQQATPAEPPRHIGHTGNHHSTTSSLTDPTTTRHSMDEQHAGHWYVVAFSQALLPGKTLVKTIADQEVVLWRTSDDEGSVQAASAVCPHWGGPLGEGAVDHNGTLTCPWHGWQFRSGYCLDRPRLKLPRYLAHDDGILLWIRLPWDIEEITTPPLQSRPAGSVAFWFDIAIESDVYHVQENYLDFLHPAEYHTTVFNHCEYLGKEGEVNLVELGYKLPFGKSLMTRTRVWAPTPFQVRNEVYEGLGKGTVIESHISPLSAERSIIHEIYHVPAATTPGRGWPLMRYFMRRSARRIREEDSLFSARRFRLRQLGFVDGRGLPVQGKVAPYLDEWPGSTEAEQATARLEKLVGKIAPSTY